MLFMYGYPARHFTFTERRISLNLSFLHHRPSRPSYGTGPKRILFMDEMRGLAVFLMVFYHGFYTLGFLFDMAWARALFLFFMPVEPLFAGLFIFICGISCCLSHSNVRRGLLLLAVALTITLVMWIFLPEEIILFGILHFLSVSILLYALLHRVLDKIPPLVGLLACAFLMLITWWIPVYNGSQVGIKGLLSWPVSDTLKNQLWLYPVGFSYIECGDYFPLLPWIFCFLGGSFCGVWAKAGRFPAWMYRKHLPGVSILGRHALIVYIVHQPVIFGVCWVVDAVVHWLR